MGTKLEGFGSDDLGILGKKQSPPKTEGPGKLTRVTSKGNKGIDGQGSLDDLTPVQKPGRP